MESVPECPWVIHQVGYSETVQHLHFFSMQILLSPHSHMSQEHSSFPRSSRYDILSNL